MILLHPKEGRKKVGTGRLTHLCVSNSILVEGVDFTANETVNKIVNDPAFFPVVLYPGRTAIDITGNDGGNTAARVEEFVPDQKELVIFVLDGSWSCAKKMLRLSRNLASLPQLFFVPPRQSAYQIRHQPDAICFSTIETVHFMIEQLRKSQRWQSGTAHENLLEVFQILVSRQLSYVRQPGQRALRGKR